MTREINAFEYSYLDCNISVGYSLDDIYDEPTNFNITPECAALIARGMFISMYGEEEVNRQEITVYDNSELASDIDKYGEFYKVGLNYPGYTDGKFMAISKIDGRILKVYWIR